MDNIGYLLEAILAVNFLVVVHELGHMLAGRLFGVRSLRFSIGLGPRILGVRFRGTEYRLAPFPVGGYVQLAQGHSHGASESCMDCLPAWKRMFIYFAGPAANLVLVLVLLMGAYGVLGFTDQQPIVRALDPDAPAVSAGFRPGDRIDQIDDKKVIAWSQVILASEHPTEQALSVQVERPIHPPAVQGARPAFEDVALSVPPEALRYLEPVAGTVRLRLDPLHALQTSAAKLRQLLGLLVQSLVGLVKHEVSSTDLVGPVYLFHISSQAAADSQAALVYLLAFISASLFFFNLLPLPVLDGGQIVLAALHRVLGRPLAPRSLRLLTHASVFWILMILASATLNDVVRLAGS